MTIVKLIGLLLCYSYVDIIQLFNLLAQAHMFHIESSYIWLLFILHVTMMLCFNANFLLQDNKVFTIILS